MFCSQTGCWRTAVEQGICAVHKEIQRRAADLARRPVGRPPRYEQDVRERFGGAPRFNLRLEPDLHRWVQSQGGCCFVQELLRAYRDAPTPAQPSPGRPVLDPAEFLTALHAAYRLGTGVQHGQVAKLLDLHQVLTLLPSTRRAYSRQAFAADVYELDRRYEAVQARTRLIFRLHRGATAARNRKNLLILPIDGGELTYYGIEFFPSGNDRSR